jgi:hypothetical protein
MSSVAHLDNPVQDCYSLQIATLYLHTKLDQATYVDLSLSLSLMCTRSLALIHRLTDPPRWRQQSCVDVVYQLVGYQTTDSTSKHCTYRTTNGQGGDRH